MIHTKAPVLNLNQDKFGSTSAFANKLKQRVRRFLLKNQIDLLCNFERLGQIQFARPFEDGIKVAEILKSTAFEEKLQKLSELNSAVNDSEAPSVHNDKYSDLKKFIENEKAK